jgi:hypothetical protein
MLQSDHEKAAVVIQHAWRYKLKYHTFKRVVLRFLKACPFVDQTHSREGLLEVIKQPNVILATKRLILRLGNPVINPRTFLIAFPIVYNSDKSFNLVGFEETRLIGVAKEMMEAFDQVIHHAMLGGSVRDMSQAFRPAVLRYTISFSQWKAMDVKQINLRNARTLTALYRIRHEVPRNFDHPFIVEIDARIASARMKLAETSGQLAEFDRTLESRKTNGLEFNFAHLAKTPFTMNAIELVHALLVNPGFRIPDPKTVMATNLEARLEVETHKAHMQCLFDELEAPNPIFAVLVSFVRSICAGFMQYSPVEEHGSIAEISNTIRMEQQVHGAAFGGPRRKALIASIVAIHRRVQDPAGIAELDRRWARMERHDFNQTRLFGNALMFLSDMNQILRTNLVNSRWVLFLYFFLFSLLTASSDSIGSPRPSPCTGKPLSSKISRRVWPTGP